MKYRIIIMVVLLASLGVLYLASDEDRNSFPPAPPQDSQGIRINP
jgi:hypothetical protein